MNTKQNYASNYFKEGKIIFVKESWNRNQKNSDTITHHWFQIPW